jgi:hypothetical protein
MATSRGESIEFVRDVEFVEEGGDEAVRPLLTVGATDDFLEEVVAVAVSEVMDLDTIARRGAPLQGRDSSVRGTVAHGRHLRQGAWLWERRRPPARRSVARGE